MNRVRIGRIIGTHGLKGAFKVLPLTDFPERFLSMKRMSLYNQEEKFLRELTLLSARYTENKGILILQAEELLSIEDAESLSGVFIEIPPEERYALGDGEFWVDDLKGLAAIRHENDVPLGTLVDVIPAGENDLYVIRDDAGKDHYIPAVEQFIAGVDLDKREIRITLIEGLWESCV